MIKGTEVYLQLDRERHEKTLAAIRTEKNELFARVRCMAIGPERSKLEARYNRLCSLESLYVDLIELYAAS